MASQQLGGAATLARNAVIRKADPTHGMTPSHQFSSTKVIKVLPPTDPSVGFNLDHHQKNDKSSSADCGDGTTTAATMNPQQHHRQLSLPPIDSDGRYSNILPSWQLIAKTKILKWQLLRPDLPKPPFPSGKEVKIKLPSVDVVDQHSIGRYSPFGCGCQTCKDERSKALLGTAAAGSKTPLLVVPPPPVLSTNIIATWTSHASFILSVGGYTILTDPVWSNRCSPVQFAGPARMLPPPIDLETEMPFIDIVTISHNHYDHLDTTTVEFLIKKNHALAAGRRRAEEAERKRQQQKGEGGHHLRRNGDEEGDKEEITAKNSCIPCGLPAKRSADATADSSKSQNTADQTQNDSLMDTHPIFIVPMGMKQQWFVPLASSLPQLNLDYVVELMWWDTADVTEAVEAIRGRNFKKYGAEFPLVGFSAGDSAPPPSAPTCVASATAEENRSPTAFTETAERKAASAPSAAAYHHPLPTLRISATPVQHWTQRGVMDRNKELWCGFVYTILGGGEKENANRGPLEEDEHFVQHIKNVRNYPVTKMFHCGDTGYYDQLFQEIGDVCGGFNEAKTATSKENVDSSQQNDHKATAIKDAPIDFAMIPIGAYEPRSIMQNQHIDPFQAAQIHKDINSQHSAGMHWGTFILTDEPIDEPPKALNYAMKELNGILESSNGNGREKEVGDASPLSGGEDANKEKLSRLRAGDFQLEMSFLVTSDATTNNKKQKHIPYFSCERPFRALMHGESWVINKL